MKSAAFTLAEVIMAVGMLALTALTLVVLALGSLRSNQKGFGLEPAAQAADRVIQLQLYAVAQDSPPGTRASFWSTQGLWRDNTLNMGGSGYQWAIYLSDAPLGAVGNRAKKLDAAVWWWDTQSLGGRQGYGRMEIQATCLVNENGP